MQSDTKIKVGVLRGGSGKYYTSSLRKGGEFISYIHENLEEKYKVFDILINKDNIWHCNGVPINRADLIYKVDLVWNTTHPSFSNILESLSVPNISVGSFFSTLENNKEMLHQHVKSIGVSVPRQIASPKTAREVFKKFGAPWIVKNSNEVKLVKTFNELTEAIDTADDVIVEEFIAGKIASIHSVPHFRNEEIYTFPLGNSFGIFSNEEKNMLALLVKDLHKHIGAKHYLKSDFILTKNGKVFLLQIDGIPDLKQNSHFEESCESVGVKMHHVVEHILERAL